MVQAIINLNEHENRVLQIVRGKFGLRNKTEAINLIINKFEEHFLEPELRPEYEKELLKIDKGKFKRFSNVEELRREIENV
ncbi:DUF2683 family protein [Candidatus Woesearchaeota archaeon]|nr:DUF2683 family protein [Candidatus Woesearchaeota archaeon]